jgi:hypothetical protein
MRALILALIAIFPASLKAQVVDSTARLAVLRFAIQQTDMLTIPRDSVVLVRETALPDGMWAGTRIAVASERSEAPALARLIGEHVPVVSAAEYLKCDKYNCAASTRFAVLVVQSTGQLASNRLTSIADADARWMGQVDLYLPGAAPDRSQRTYGGMQVRMERRSEGWIGVEYMGGNRGRPVRIPPIP